jgi:hypothetical protein
VWQKSPHGKNIQLLKNYQGVEGEQLVPNSALGLVKVDRGASAANLVKEVVALVVDHDERWEVLNFDLPNSFHA